MPARPPPFFLLSSHRPLTLTLTTPTPILSLQHLQTRSASLLRRPLRPYLFTSLTQLSDGSYTLTRSTSPTPLYRTQKDSRNNALWNPSEARLRNVEEDDSGRLRGFRRRFGRGWDVDAGDEEDGEEGEKMEGKGKKGEEKERDGGLMDLISGFGAEGEEGEGVLTEQARKKGMGGGK
ncbi:MAG: hypothetical protein M1817_002755 [Caeruleum heppii]|nr:MAG: hypothetical protein M1817_002755 [Caeruleum heppii]